MELCDPWLEAAHKGAARFDVVFIRSSSQLLKETQLKVAVLAAVVIGAALNIAPIQYLAFVGVGIVLISLIGWVVFRQTLDTPALLGMGLIVAGVLVINLFSRSVAH